MHQDSQKFVYQVGEEYAVSFWGSLPCVLIQNVESTVRLQRKRRVVARHVFLWRRTKVCMNDLAARGRGMDMDAMDVDDVKLPLYTLSRHGRHTDSRSQSRFGGSFDTATVRVAGVLKAGHGSDVLTGRAIEESPVQEPWLLWTMIWGVPPCELPQHDDAPSQRDDEPVYHIDAGPVPESTHELLPSDLPSLTEIVPTAQEVPQPSVVGVTVEEVSSTAPGVIVVIEDSPPATFAVVAAIEPSRATPAPTSRPDDASEDRKTDVPPTAPAAEQEYVVSASTPPALPSIPSTEPVFAEPVVTASPAPVQRILAADEVPPVRLPKAALVHSQSVEERPSPALTISDDDNAGPLSTPVVQHEDVSVEQAQPHSCTASAPESQHGDTIPVGVVAVVSAEPPHISSAGTQGVDTPHLATKAILSINDVQSWPNGPHEHANPDHQITLAGTEIAPAEIVSTSQIWLDGEGAPSALLNDTFAYGGDAPTCISWPQEQLQSGDSRDVSNQAAQISGVWLSAEQSNRLLPLLEYYTQSAPSLDVVPSTSYQTVLVDEPQSTVPADRNLIDVNAGTIPGPANLPDVDMFAIPQNFALEETDFISAEAVDMDVVASFAQPRAQSFMSIDDFQLLESLQSEQAVPMDQVVTPRALVRSASSRMVLDSEVKPVKHQMTVTDAPIVVDDTASAVIVPMDIPETSSQTLAPQAPQAINSAPSMKRTYQSIACKDPGRSPPTRMHR
ncbi:hypothetical protein NM688_g8408 [Phlebia brevispora]|uniref:Uncharacterized protein n=1 Tax=Phlebia brevispora TaxID=194682 RepID=A0ACC1RTF7_9APHY|nr:hypothetical protein NM688_g8408 [Phlebia brevispora]